MNFTKQLLTGNNRPYWLSWYSCGISIKQWIQVLKFEVKGRLAQMLEDCFPSVGTQNANPNFGGSGQERVGLSPLPSHQVNIMT